MSTQNETDWTVGRIIGVGLFTLLVGGVTYDCDGNLGLIIYLTLFAFFVAGIVTDPNVPNRRIALRSTPRSRGPLDDGDILPLRQTRKSRGVRKCRAGAGCIHCDFGRNICR